MTAAKQFVDEIRPDESGRAGDKTIHNAAGHDFTVFPALKKQK
jgi:hypothetical protein